MENENFHALEEKEETMECPYKKFKFDSDDDEPSFVTTIEDSNEKDNSIGDNNGGNLQESAVPSGFDGLDENGDAGSENGEDCVTGSGTRQSMIFSYSCLGSDSENGLESDDNYEEIESLLDQALPDELKNKKRDYEERFKVIMEGDVGKSLFTGL